MILDCSSYNSVTQSLCEIFRTTEDVLLSVLKSVEYDESIDYYTLEQNVSSFIRARFGEPDDKLEILWFHGTRVEDPALFYSHGILPKSQVRDELLSRLISLTSGLEKLGDNPFSLSVSVKADINDEGPFAFLVKSAAIHANGNNHNYTKSPELVEDIAGILLGENYQQLVSRFQEVTKPYIVSFTAKPKGGEVSRALLFLKLMEDGESEIEAGESANTFFSSHGVTILPDRIKDIERAVYV
jgi:hypothetical protein